MALCAQSGWQVLPFAPIHIERLPEKATNLWQQLQQAHAVFWVSPTAVETACEMLAEVSGSLKNIAATHIAVGKATASQLSQSGIKNAVVGEQGNDSEAVLTLPLWDRLPENAQVLIVRGVGGRDWLAQQLSARGFAVCITEIYRRVPCPVDWAAFEQTNLSAAWVTSSELARELFTQAPPKLTQKLHSLLYFTHHERICATLRHLGAQHIYCVENLESALHHSI